MAGVRIGYAVGQAATIKKMAAYRMPYNVNTFGVAAAVASLKDPAHIKEEAARNNGGPRLHDQGARGPRLHVDGLAGEFHLYRHRKTMTAAAFRDACAAKGVMVGRDFPPMEKQWARISMGTMDEMQKATDVFRSVLKPATTTASGKGQ